MAQTGQFGMVLKILININKIESKKKEVLSSLGRGVMKEMHAKGYVLFYFPIISLHHIVILFLDIISYEALLPNNLKNIC